MSNDVVTSTFTRRSVVLTHNIIHTLKGDTYKDSFGCIIPEGTEDAQAWAEAEVARRRPHGSWTVLVVPLKP